jgi:hypothetical protein
VTKAQPLKTSPITALLQFKLKLESLINPAGIPTKNSVQARYAIFKRAKLCSALGDLGRSPEPSPVVVRGPGWLVIIIIFRYNNHNVRMDSKADLMVAASGPRPSLNFLTKVLHRHKFR